MLKKVNRGGVAMWQEEESVNRGVIKGVREKQQRSSSQGGWGVNPQYGAQAPVPGVVHAA